MRRVHLRGRENILKRLPVHVAGFNLSLVLRLMLGKGTPRGLQDLATQYFFRCSGPNKGFRALFAGSALSAPLGISGIRVGLFHALDYSNAGCVLVDPDTKIPPGHGVREQSLALARHLCWCSLLATATAHLPALVRTEQQARPPRSARRSFRRVHSRHGAVLLPNLFQTQPSSRATPVLEVSGILALYAFPATSKMPPATPRMTPIPRNRS